MFKRKFLLIVVIACIFSGFLQAQDNSENWIVFTAEIGSFSEAFRVNPATSVYKQLSHSDLDVLYRSVGDISCRRDISDQIAFIANYGVYVTNGASQEEAISPGEQAIYNIDWSSDGHRLALSGHFGYSAGEEDIFIFDLATSALTPIVQSQNLDYAPSWSPNGQDIAYVFHQNDGTYGINLVQSNGTNIRPVIHSTYSIINSPQWSPDGQWLVFDMDGVNSVDLYKVRPDGTQLTQLTQNTGNNILPVWSPDGSLISFSSDRSGEYEIYVMSTDRVETHQVELPSHFIHGNLFNQCWMRLPVVSVATPNP